ncbi:MAG: hypothetical protein ABF266_11490, partial [Celeribacter marinus]
GGVVMEDAETLITSNDITIRVVDGLTSDASGNIEIDLIVAGSATRLEALGGAVLDNTLSELIDNIVSPMLHIVADEGIGAEWSDTLDTNTQLLSAINYAQGGINIQNRTGLTVADAGISNTALGDIVIISPDVIEHGYMAYGTSDGTRLGSVFAVPGQRMFLIHNQAQPFFDSNWGNLNRVQVVQALSVPASARATVAAALFSAENSLFALADLFGANAFGTHDDPYDRFLRRFEFEEEQDEEGIRPILIADYLLRHMDENAELTTQQKALDSIEEAANTAPANPTGNDEADETPLMPENTGYETAIGNQGLDVLEAFDDSHVTEEQAASDLNSIASRPVVLQAMLLSDDEIDMPLIAAE